LWLLNASFIVAGSEQRSHKQGRAGISAQHYYPPICQKHLPKSEAQQAKKDEI
jgi:hypothetical protein